MPERILASLRDALGERLEADGVELRLEGDTLVLLDAQLPPGTTRELRVQREGEGIVLSARDPQGGQLVPVARAATLEEAARACVHWFDDPQ
ncbi:MAG TPA: hypothetical protein VNT60_02900 [Deinococcales bacterium]|nr:hypothetical protein [Deinococcales bacterium]